MTLGLRTIRSFLPRTVSSRREIVRHLLTISVRGGGWVRIRYGARTQPGTRTDSRNNIQIKRWMAINFSICNLCSLTYMIYIEIYIVFYWDLRIESSRVCTYVLSNIHFVSLPFLYPIKVFIFKRPVKKTLKLTVAQLKMILKLHKN